MVVDKAYEYLTIGNFFSNEETTVKEYENFTTSAYIPPYAYYLIDDVKLWYEGTKPTEPPPTKTMRRKPIPAKNVYTKDFIIENVQVEFEYDKADLLNDQSAELDTFIENLKSSPSKYNLHVIGHTDERGSNNYNLDLSLRRAQTVVKYFIKNGITPNEIISSGKGETQPLVNNNSEENRRLNRRVEVRLTKIK